MQGATGYKVYRGDSAGSETLIKTISTATTGYTDNDTGRRATEHPTDDLGAQDGSELGHRHRRRCHGGRGEHEGLPQQREPRRDHRHGRDHRSAASAFTASSTSGAGGSSVGVAGSIAVTRRRRQHDERCRGHDPVNVNGADVNLNATRISATPQRDRQAGDRRQRERRRRLGRRQHRQRHDDRGPPGRLAISSAKNLTINATDTDAMTTTANGGAAAGSGALALSAQAAITISNVTTSATVGSGPT